MDALQSFIFLTENLPIWISRLHELSRQASERHAEFTKLSQTSSYGSIRRKKNGSTESLRPRDTKEDERSPHANPEPSPISTPIQINPASKHLFQQHREEKIRRRQKSGSVASGASGQQRFRTRMSMIVYYDSTIQEGFETLVRNVSSARNTLRKGKTAANFKARMASMGTEESPFGGEGIMELRNPRIPRMSRSRNGLYAIEGYVDDSFDLIDKDLETAQSLCEVGAHQFLRDGNCIDEILGTKGRLENCLRLAEQQVVALQLEQKQEYETQEERQNRFLITTNLPGEELEINLSAVKPENMARVHDTLAGMDNIEVDDKSDASSVHIDFTAFRSARNPR
ncbi:hypothetical protein MMC34_004637 [Xylographa carneopallida]|nr:hypothetical protein [Xylographa carneopallida]